MQENILKALEIMGNGMLAIFVVIGILIGSVAIMRKIDQMTEHKNNKDK